MPSFLSKSVVVVVSISAGILSSLPQCLSFRPPTNLPTRTLFEKTYRSTSVPLYMAESDDGRLNDGGRSSMVAGAGVSNAGEPPFEIRGFSLGNVIILAGILLTSFSFVEYLNSSEGGDNLNLLSGFGFVYGLPLFLGGSALKYAEIEPVPCYSTPEGDAAYETKATETIKKIVQDVTRHRYGDEAHLDTTVKKLGLVVPGKAYPQLIDLRKEATEDGELAFSMVWQSLDTPYKMWADERRIQKYNSFFGPGVTAECVKIDAEQKMVAIRLTTTSNVPKPSEATVSS